jgi:RNA polymerase sigma factor (sigma-70 family)
MPVLTAEASQEMTDRASLSDTRLVKECLKGSSEAWSALIDRYKRLIYSIPVKYGFSPDEASDIFQAVCLELLSELPKLRKPEALAKWIMQVTAHKCFHRRKERQRMVSGEDTGQAEPAAPAQIEAILREVEEEQHLRRVISELPPRCQQLVRMLFYEEPSRPYRDIAAELGIATGSIGFIRQRCLARLQKRLLDLGFS